MNKQSAVIKAVCGMPREGIFALVLTEGEARVGDLITVEEKA